MISSSTRWSNSSRSCLAACWLYGPVTCRTDSVLCYPVILGHHWAIPACSGDPRVSQAAVPVCRIGFPAMRIAINGLFLQEPRTGTGRYLYNLLNALGRVDGINEYLVLSPHDPLEVP